MAIAPFPDKIPGLFFVLSYFKDQDLFRIYLDDENKSSYSLRIQPKALSGKLTACGVDAQTAQDAVDRAIEFRLVQCIPDQKRVISLHKRTSSRSVSLPEQEASNGFVHI